LATRSRVLPYNGSNSATVTETIYPTIGPVRTTTEVVSTNAFSAFQGSQVTDSENHPEWNNIRSSGSSFFGDVGGSFLSRKRYVTSTNVSDYRLYGDDAFGASPKTVSSDYLGPLLCQAPGDCQFPAYADSSDSELRTLGTHAIAMCAPTNPAANLSTFLGEFLTEGIPDSVGEAFRHLNNSVNLTKLPKTTKGLKHVTRKTAKAGSKEFLNSEFGWLPILSDMSSLSIALMNAERIIAQFERDAGRVVRRGWNFKPEVETSIVPVSADRYGPWTVSYNSLWYHPSKPPKGQVWRETTVSRTRWFKGAFTYFIPPRQANKFGTEDIGRRISEAQKLLGAAPTPGTVWNLLPWSWLVDWFSNVGDLAKNLDAMIIDSQVLVYGYMMEHTVSTNTYTLVGPYYLRDGTVGPAPASISMVSETKKRVQASPYGFGLTLGGLSTLQMSILAALGITRVRR
jgi:hypothetical protein